MRPFASACAIVFLIGCHRIPSAAPSTPTSFAAADAGAPPAVATPDDPATGVTTRPDAGSVDNLDGGTGVAAGDMTAGNLCAGQIDPGTHNAVALRGDDRELFYMALFATADARELRAVAKDGMSPPRTVAVIGHDTSMPWDVALDGNDVYVENGSKIWRVAKSGGTPVVVYQVPSGGTNSPTYEMCQFVVDATNLYWRQQTGYGPPAVWYLPKSGGAAKTIGGDASHIAVGGGTLYGGYVTDVWAAAVGAGGASFDLSRGGFVLTADATRAILASSDKTVDAVAQDGSVTVLAANVDQVKSAATYDGVVYLLDDHSVRRIDSGVATPIFTVANGVLGPDLVVDDAFVYTQTICNIARIPR